MASTSVQDFERERNEYKTILNYWKNNRRRLVNELNAIADKIEKDSKNSRVAKLTGASASVVGTGMAIAGAVAAPLTFGASLGLTIAGGVLAGAGTLTAAGAGLTDRLLRKTNVKQVQGLIKEDMSRTKQVREQYNKIKKMADQVKQASDTPLRDAWNGCKVGAAIGSTVTKGADMAAQATGKSLVAFKTLSQTSKIFFIGGIAVAVLLDLYTLVTESIKVHKKYIPGVVKDIRNKAKEMKDEMENVEQLDY